MSTSITHIIIYKYMPFVYIISMYMTFNLTIMHYCSHFLMSQIICQCRSETESPSILKSEWDIIRWLGSVQYLNGYSTSWLDHGTSPDITPPSPQNPRKPLVVDPFNIFRLKKGDSTKSVEPSILHIKST